MPRSIWIDEVEHDLRYALRALRRSPGLAIIAIASLAIALGATTAAFAVVDALALRKLPVHDPDRLVTLERTTGSTRIYGVDTMELARYRRLDRVFSGVAGVEMVDRWNVAIDRAPLGAVHVALVSGNYFSVLGLAPALGAMLSPADDTPGANPVVVVSDAFWRKQLAGDRNAIGRRLHVNGAAYTIAGVTPAGFSGDWVGRPADVWVPLAMHARVISEAPARFDVRVIGRLRDGVTLQRAAADAQVTYEGIKRTWIESGQYPPAMQRGWAPRVTIEPIAAGYSPQRRALATPLAILVGLVVCLLLAACTNVSTLLLSRASARNREMAVRRALGASPGRLVRQLLTESLVLAAAGGVGGTLLAFWGTHLLSRFVSIAPAPFLGSESNSASLVLSIDPNPDARVVAFAFILCLVTGVVFGLAPALRGARAPLTPALARRPRRTHLDEALVVTQVAISVLMIVGAGLAAITLRNLRTQTLGFDREHLLLVWADPSSLNLSGVRLTNTWHAVQGRLATLPGVRSVSVSSMGLLNGYDAMTGTEFFTRPGAPPRAGEKLVNTKVTPGFFETVGIPVVEGRDFTRLDTDSAPPVVILNETTARFYFGTEDPVGKPLDFVRPHTFGAYRVIGVVRDTKNGPREARAGAIYYPSGQHFGGNLPTMVVVVRANADPIRLASSVAAAVRDAVPQLPILQVDTVEEQLGVVLARERLLSALGGFFGVLSALLTCLGIYGVISYATRRRAHEIGVRMALGATPWSVLADVLRQSSVLALAGLVIGIPVALVVTRLVSSQVYGVDAADPRILLGATGAMVAVALVAGLGPARRAAKVDPVIALRSE